MAALGLDDDELKALEQTLSRFAQLSSSIQSLKQDILRSNPLPPPSSIQASAQILQRNLQTVLDSLSENSDVFSRIAIRPSTNYPGRTQENLLTQLLRKKLEPDVEELVSQGRETARLATPEGIAQLDSLWRELREWTNSRIAKYVREEAGQPYTKEEREMGIENVRTGLKRNVEEESDEEGDEEEEEEAEGQQQIRGPEPETLLWFFNRGDFEVPPNVEYNKKTGPIAKGLEGVYQPPAPAAQGDEQMQGVEQS